MRNKPRPIHHRKPKALGWTREKPTGFLLPRLNDPTGRTEAIGFMDFRSYPRQDGTDDKRFED